MAKIKLVKNVYLQPLVQMRIVVKNLPAKKIPWRKAWQPTPVSLPAESHGQSSLVGYSLWGHKESDMAENTHTCAIIHSSTDNSHGL